MLFLKNNDTSNLCQSTWNMITYLCKLISSFNRSHNCRNGIRNNSKHPVILSAPGSIYLNMKDETGNKKHMAIKHEREKMAAALISTIMLTKSHGRRAMVWRYHLLWSLFVSGKWLCISCSNQSKLSRYIFGCPYVRSFAFLRQSLRGAPCMHKCLAVWKLQ